MNPPRVGGQGEGKRDWEVYPNGAPPDGVPEWSSLESSKATGKALSTENKEIKDLKLDLVENLTITPKTCRIGLTFTENFPKSPQLLKKKEFELY